MLIGLPNPDGSFTCTMFAPFKLFDKLDAGGDAAIAAFFDKYFPDAVSCCVPALLRTFSPSAMPLH